MVVNDGSSDRTLEVLKERSACSPFPEVVRRRLATAPLRGVYRSPSHPELKVIDKENGGKADALNAGINAAQYPLFCALDADGVLRPDSLQFVTGRFSTIPHTVAAGGIIRIANGCDVVNGWIVRTGLPRRALPLLQVVEYCRAFLFGRLGWNPCQRPAGHLGRLWRLSQGNRHRGRRLSPQHDRRGHGAGRAAPPDAEPRGPTVPHRLRARARLLDRGAGRPLRRCAASAFAGSAVSARASG